MASLYSSKTVSDLVLLPTISEQSILQTLRERHHNDDIYTYIGNVLLSVNPFKMLPIYGEKSIHKFQGRYMYEVPPHIYALAEHTTVALRSEQVNQCVIISGESGSGKTEASKLLMQYVAAVSGNTSDIVRVKDRLLQSNPVLEAFGNAKTLRNNNSSRFGKYMEVAFSFNSDPVGGTIRNFLLEKSRVVNPSQGERNFHIFYQITNGMSQSDGEQYFMREPSFFRYLSLSNCFEVSGINDEEELSLTLEGLQALGVEATIISEILSVVASVLWIGQIEFDASQDGEACNIRDQTPLNIVAQLLGCDQQRVADALLFQTIVSNKEAIKTPNKVAKAEFTRDAFAKEMYSRLFEWIVERVNKAIDPNLNKNIPMSDPVASIGILDIYGFEIFDHNSFEQFCINYANEKLQQVFISRTLQAEQVEYDAEGIQWDHIQYFDNQVVCDLIEKKPYGIIPFLDEACVIPQGSSETFLKSLQRFSTHPHYETKHHRGTVFTIVHYAGKVDYDAAEFLTKNKDIVSRDLLIIGEKCGLPLLRRMFASDLKTDSSAKLHKTRSNTTATQFRAQVNALAQTLLECAPHYIRCIKPNDQKRSSVFNDAIALHQIKYLGLLENVRVRRAGFAFRMPYKRFLNRFKMLSAKTWPLWNKAAREGVATILLDSGMVEHSQFELGHTKVFIREPINLFALEELRSRRLHDLATIIQKVFRSWQARKYFEELRERAMGLFGNQKLRRVDSFARRFFGDYVAASERIEVQSLMNRHDESRILFIDQVTKINRRFKPQRRMLLLSEKSLFNLSVSKFKLRRRILIDTIASVSMSQLADNYIVIHVKDEYDYVYEVERKTEFVTALSNQYKAVTNQDLQLEFNNNLLYCTKNNLKRPISFQANTTNNPQTVMTIKNGNNMLVAVGSIATVSMDKANQSSINHIKNNSSKSVIPKRIGVGDPVLAPARLGVHMILDEKSLTSQRQQTYNQNSSSALNINEKLSEEWARAMYMFSGTDETEITMNAGDEMQVLERLDDGWWQVNLNGVLGYAPSNYLQIIERPKRKHNRHQTTKDMNSISSRVVD